MDLGSASRRPAGTLMSFFVVSLHTPRIKMGWVIMSDKQLENKTQTCFLSIFMLNLYLRLI